MDTPRIHTISFEDFDAKYLIWETIGKFHEFVAYRKNHLSEKNQKVLSLIHWNAKRRIDQASLWYGLPIPKDLETLKQYDRTTDMEKVRLVSQNLQKGLMERLGSLETVSIEKPTLVKNSSGLGVFSFDRAMMGLYRLQPKLKHPPLARLLSQLQIATDTRNKATTIRDCFLHFGNKTKKIPAITLCVMMGGNSELEGEQLRYIGIALVVLTKFMEARGVAVKICGILGSFNDNTFYSSIITLKKYSDPMDENQLLLLTSDPRYYRFRGLEGLVTTYDGLETITPTGLGKIQNDKAKPFIQAIDSNALVFENSYSMDAAINELTRIITQYSNSL